MRSIARRHVNKTRMKQYITPTLTVRPIIHEGMLCVSMRQRVFVQINDEYQSGSDTDGSQPAFTHGLDYPNIFADDYDEQQ